MLTYFFSSSSSHTQASRSKWLVGSSRRSIKGLRNRALKNKGITQMSQITLVHTKKNRHSKTSRNQKYASDSFCHCTAALQITAQHLHYHSAFYCIIFQQVLVSMDLTQVSVTPQWTPTLHWSIIRLVCIYLASATRILQPPLKSLSFFCCIDAVKPRPCRIRDARTSALSASSSSSRSYSSISFSHSANKQMRGKDLILRGNLFACIINTKNTPKHLFLNWNIPP